MTDWTVNSLCNHAVVADALASQRLGHDAVLGKAKLFHRCAIALATAGVAADTPVHAFFVPGRIEVLGKHTDYAGGRSIVAAVERGFCVVGSPRRDTTVRVLDVVDEDRSEFLFRPDLSPTLGHWSNYPMTVARRIARNFPGDLRGMDIAFASDLPAASGMSSSSALIVACFLALSKVNSLPASPAYAKHIRSLEDLSGYLGTVENGQSFGELAGDAGVGTFGGSEDHTAILCSQGGVLSQYSYCPVRFERAIRVDEEYSFVIAFSGVAAEKTGEAQEFYNRVSLRASAAMDVWRAETGRDDPHFAAAIQSSTEAAATMRELLARNEHHDFRPQELLDRFEQFLAESERIIPAVADILTPATTTAFGELVHRSQTLTTNRLRNQVPQTVFLADAARQQGAAAASAFGAGFGGSVWAMVRTEETTDFTSRWSDAYREAFPDEAKASTFFTTRPGPGAFELLLCHS